VLSAAWTAGGGSLGFWAHARSSVGISQERGPFTDRSQPDQFRDRRRWATAAATPPAVKRPHPSVGNQKQSAALARGARQFRYDPGWLGLQRVIASGPPRRVWRAATAPSNWGATGADACQPGPNVGSRSSAIRPTFLNKWSADLGVSGIVLLFVHVVTARDGGEPQRPSRAGSPIRSLRMMRARISGGGARGESTQPLPSTPSADRRGVRTRASSAAGTTCSRCTSVPRSTRSAT
jgi:hypothetical protein